VQGEEKHDNKNRYHSRNGSFTGLQIFKTHPQKNNYREIFVQAPRTEVKLAYYEAEFWSSVANVIVGA
jgi:hypothetical protein